MTTPFPRPWLTLVLEDASCIERIIARAPELREATTALDAFQVEPGVLARYEGEPPAAARLRPSGADQLPQVGALLHFSGGDPESELRAGRCSPNKLENEMARQFGAAGRAMTDDPQNPRRDEPGLARVRTVLRLALRAVPDALGVIVPEARSFIEGKEFIERNADVDNLAHVPGRTTMSAYEVDNRGRWVQTVGNVVYGIPEIGLMTLGEEDPMALVQRVLAPLHLDMMSWGYAPPEGESVSLDGQDWQVSRSGVGVWLQSPQTLADPKLAQLSRHLNYQASFLRIAAKHFDVSPIVQAHPWRDDSAAPLHRVDVMLRADDMRVMTTNGVGFRPRPGFSPNDGCIEVYTLVSRDGPRIAHALSALSECAHMATPEQPFHFFDRMPFPEPIAGIAAVLLAPRFDLYALVNHRVTWCLAVPITSEELAAIRDGSTSGQQLVESFDEQGQLPQVLERWTALTDA